MTGLSPRPRAAGAVDRQAGLATAETAVALPCLVLVVLLAVGLLHGVGVVLRCQDAARLAATSLGRGDPPGTALAAGRAAGGAGTRVQVRPDGTLETVTVSAVVGIPGPWEHLLPHWQVSGTANALPLTVGASP